jgi:hypothetical protein
MAWQCVISKVYGQVLACIGEPEEGQKPTADDQLKTGSRAGRQAQDQGCHQNHRAEREIIFLFEHPAAAALQPPAGGRGEESVLGVGRDAFEEFNFLQNTTGAFSHGAHRIFCEMHWQAGFAGD